MHSLLHHATHEVPRPALPPLANQLEGVQAVEDVVTHVRVLVMELQRRPISPVLNPHDRFIVPRGCAILHDHVPVTVSGNEMSEVNL